MIRQRESRPTVRTAAALACTLFLAFVPVAHAVNQPPVVSGTPTTTAVVGTLYEFQPTAVDPEGRKLVFWAVGKPAWLTISSTTGRLSGTPPKVGTTGLITIVASDTMKTARLPAFAITITATPPNNPPTITGAPLTTATAGIAYSFRPLASDTNGDVLTFSIVGKPAWAAFEASTGTLYGTPLAIDAGTYSGVSISVCDGKDTTSLAQFAIIVTPPPNRSPIISGSAVTAAQAERPYAFQPAAVDPDGDSLSYSITGKPTWATFDPARGTLYGTPTAVNVGTSGSIIISVSDGKASATLPAFAITVAAVPTKSVTLNWTAPTMNTDGSALTGLAGYAVSYGTASGQYTTILRLSGAATDTVVIEGLQTGTYYFAIKTITNTGDESEFSGEVVAKL